MNSYVVTMIALTVRKLQMGLQRLILVVCVKNQATLMKVFITSRLSDEIMYLKMIVFVS